MTKVFLSYARKDDMAFVKRLYQDLTDRGFQVWWDQASMPSRLRSFRQEIRDAVTACDRVVVVFGPFAQKSASVRFEWKYALSIGKGVNPLLRLGEYESLPDELKLLDAPDFRDNKTYADSLEKLVSQISEPVAPLGKLIGVPELPANFLPRPEELGTLKETVLADIEKPVVVTGTTYRVGVQGMGGIGKSVLAAALARHPDVRRAFPDGVLWVTIGRQPALTARQSQVVEALGDGPRAFEDVQQGKARLSELLAGRTCLIILDDVWAVEHADAFDALSPDSRLLITTRDAALIETLGAVEHRLDVLSSDQALDLLARWSGTDVHALPPKAAEIAKECGRLPLALAMIGAMVRDRPDRWENALHKLRTADLEKIKAQFPNYPYPDLLRSLQVSVDALEPEFRPRYLDLAVFPEDTPIPEAALRTYWAAVGLDTHDTQDVLDALVDRSLARRDEQGRISLHDLQFDYVRGQADDLPALHTRLLAAYRAECPNGWHTGPNDGYFFEHLAYHLVQARREEELRGLLLDFDWLQAKLNATDAAALVADYELLPDDPTLCLVQGAIRLSSHVLTPDKSQLRSQLYGRLLAHESPEIGRLLDGICHGRGAPWLRSLTASLTPPGGPLLRTLEGHTSGVLSVAVFDDGKRAVSASGDRTLKVWDLQTGDLLRTLEGHTDSVLSVAVFDDGKRAVSASDDRTLKVWDLHTGDLLRTLKGHTRGVNAVAVFDDGKRAVSASDDRTLKVWDLQTGDLLRTLKGHTDSVLSVAVFDDGKRAVSAPDDRTLKVWDLETGAIVASFSGDSPFLACAAAPDGVTFAAGDQSGRVHSLRLEGVGS